MESEAAAQCRFPIMLFNLKEPQMYAKFAAGMLATVMAMPAWADSYTIDSSHTFPSFEIDHLGFSTQRGRFNNTQGKLILDEDKKTGSVEISIDAASIDTGFAKLEEHLRAEDFFDVKRFPTLTFHSTQFRFAEDRVASVSGNLTLHGVTLPVNLTVQRMKCGINVARLRKVCGADLATTIKRSDFGISKGTPFVGDEVRITIQVEAIRD